MGFLSDSRTYYNHIDKYTDICHVITIDLPGHGEDQSSMDETWNFDYITTLLDRILDKYKDKSITLFGYSMGDVLHCIMQLMVTSHIEFDIRKYVTRY